MHEQGEVRVELIHLQVRRHELREAGRSLAQERVGHRHPIDLRRRTDVVRALSAAQTVHPEHAGLDRVTAGDERDVEASVRLMRKAQALADTDAVVGEPESGVVN